MSRTGRRSFATSARRTARGSTAAREGTFQPPAHLARQLGINEVKLTIDYLGANLKVRMRVDKKGLRHDKAIDQVFEIPRLRAASQPEVNATIKAMLDQLLAQYSPSSRLRAVRAASSSSGSTARATCSGMAGAGTSSTRGAASAATSIAPT